MTTSYIGQALNRVDGRLKVTGAAKYAAEFNTPDLLHGYVVSSHIAKGKITRIDTAAALAVPGVIQVFTHRNRPRTAWFDRSYRDDVAPPGSPFRPLYDEHILYSGQPIALVVAETLDLARFAASLVQVDYRSETHQTDLDKVREQAYKPKFRSEIDPPPKPRGQPEDAFAKSAVQHAGEYLHPIEHHNPMEMHASTVIYDSDGALTVYDKTQGVQNSQKYLTGVFGLSKDKVHVLSPFVGGAFGSGLRPQYQLFLATMAALALKRSVKVSLTRQQMFTFGHRPNTIQDIRLGAAANGKLEVVMHEVLAETSRFEDFTENVVNWSGMLYQCDNVKLDHKLAKLDVYTPIDMRAPGAATGVWAFESAIDELTNKLKIDPLAFRLNNYAERDQNQDKPFSSKELRACYRQGAERFGWSKRNPEPRSMRDGHYLIGWGMATGVWDTMYAPTAARAILRADGRLDVGSAAADIGTGTYTIMTQIAAETLGLPMAQVTFKLGDSKLPPSPVEGGSRMAASCGSAVMEVCEAIGKKLYKLAIKLPGTPFANVDEEDTMLADGHLLLRKNPAVKIAITEIMRRSTVPVIEEDTTARINYAWHSLKQRQYARNSHSAVFAEVKVDEDLGTVLVTRVVSAVAGGRVLNPKTARSQILGAVVWGIGMALHEESVVDQQFGRIMNHNLAEYHVPVNADISAIDVIFVEEHDPIVNPLGIKGLGEIGIVGVPAAVANAIYHATGKRVRDLPITLDKLL